MAAESEEALRLVVIIGQAAVPALADIIKSLFHALSNRLSEVRRNPDGTRRRGIIGTIVGVPADRLKGHGDYGIVSPKKLEGDRTTVDVTDFNDEGLVCLRDLAIKARVGFAVIERKAADGTPIRAIQFKVKDAQTFETFLKFCVRDKIADDAEAKRAMDDLHEILEAEQPQKPESKTETAVTRAPAERSEKGMTAQTDRDVPKSFSMNSKKLWEESARGVENHRKREARLQGAALKQVSAHQLHRKR